MTNIYNKYITLSLPVKASFWYTICNILQKIVSFITIPIFTRIMNSEQYGYFSIYLSWKDIILLFSSLSLYNAVFNKAMIKYKNDRNGVISSWQSLITIISLFLFTLYFIFRNILNEFVGLNITMIIILFLDVFFSPSLSFWMAKSRYEYKYRNVIIVTMCMTLVNPIVGILTVLSTTYKAEARIFSCAFVSIIFGAFFFIKFFKKGKKLYNYEYWKFALKMNIPLIPHYLSGVVLNQSDRLMISYYCGVNKSAVYSISYTVAMMMMIVVNAINASMTPWTYQSLKDNNIKSVYKVTNSLCVFIGIMIIAVELVAPEIIWIIGGSEYMETINVFPYLASSVFFIFLYSRFADIEFYFEKNKQAVLASLLSAIVNLGLNAIFIPKFGYYFAGITTFICYIFYSAFHMISMRRILNFERVKEQYNFKVILMISLLIILITIVCPLIYNYTFMRYILLLIIAVIALYRKELIIKLICQSIGSVK